MSQADLSALIPVGSTPTPVVPLPALVVTPVVPLPALVATIQAARAQYPRRLLAATIPDEAYLSARALTYHFEVDGDWLRHALADFRASRGDGWVEVQDRAKNEPAFLYLLGAVRGLMPGAPSADAADAGKIPPP